MNQLNEISDEDFVPFLHSLGVDTYKKSFEWLLNDPAFAGVLRWMYHNLDENNALTAREEYRCLELEKKGKLLSSDDLESRTKSIQDQYQGICLPGDKVGLNAVKMDITMQKERLAMLTKQEAVLEDLNTKNKLLAQNKIYYLRNELDPHGPMVLARLGTMSEQECHRLAWELVQLSESVIDVITDTLEQYVNTQNDNEMSEKFLMFGPFESYRQSQALFRSHFDLYTTKNFNRKPNDNVTDEKLQSVLTQAMAIEERFTNSVYAYIESKTDLAGEQAKLDLIANYTTVHPSQITIATMEAQSALELLEQEEMITMQQLQSAVKQLVDNRAKMAVGVVVKAAIAVREQIQQEVVYLQDICLEALYLDRVLYSTLRHALQTIQEVVQFAAQLWTHTMNEQSAVQYRINTMEDINNAHNVFNSRPPDYLENIVYKILDLPQKKKILMKKTYNEIDDTIKRLTGEIQEEYLKSGNHLSALASRPVHSLVTAPGSAPLLSSLVHKLTAAIKETEQNTLNATDTFTNIKKGDKTNLRKLWQWFLTDQQRFLTAVKEVSPKSY